MNRTLTTEVWQINETAYDTEAKELVKISNGTPICKFFQKGVSPTEAVAIRFLTLNQGKPQLAFTYRKVDPKKLRKTTHTLDMLDTLGENPYTQHYDFLGRV